MVAIATKQTASDADTAVEIVDDRGNLGVLESEPRHEDAYQQAPREGGSASWRNGVRPSAATVIETRHLELSRRSSVALVYDRWFASWEAALAALTTATHAGTLSTNDAAIHRTVIAAEREIVTRQLRLLGWVERDGVR